MLPGRTGPATETRYMSGTGPGPAGRPPARSQVGEVELGAVAVEVHHVIRPPRLLGRVQHLRQPGEGGRAQHIQVQARPSGSAPPRTSRLATDRNGTSARPPGRQITSSTRSRSPAGSGRSGCPAARRWVRTNAPRPAPPPRRGPGRAATPTPGPGPAPGSASTSTRTSPAGPGPAPRSRRVRLGKHPAEQVRAGLRQPPPPPARSPGPDRPGTPRNPPDTSGSAPRPRHRAVTELGHRHPARRAVLPGHLHPPLAARPCERSLIRNSATTSPQYRGYYGTAQVSVMVRWASPARDRGHLPPQKGG